MLHRPRHRHVAHPDHGRRSHAAPHRLDLGPAGAVHRALGHRLGSRSGAPRRRAAPRLTSRRHDDALVPPGDVRRPALVCRDPRIRAAAAGGGPHRHRRLRRRVDQRRLRDRRARRLLRPRRRRHSARPRPGRHRAVGADLPAPAGRLRRDAPHRRHRRHARFNARRPRHRRLVAQPHGLRRRPALVARAVVRADPRVLPARRVRVATPRSPGGRCARVRGPVRGRRLRPARQPGVLRVWLHRPRDRTGIAGPLGPRVRLRTPRRDLARGRPRRRPRAHCCRHHDRIDSGDGCVLARRDVPARLPRLSPDRVRRRRYLLHDRGVAQRTARRDRRTALVDCAARGRVAALSSRCRSPSTRAPPGTAPRSPSRASRSRTGAASGRRAGSTSGPATVSPSPRSPSPGCRSSVRTPASRVSARRSTSPPRSSTRPPPSSTAAASPSTSSSS